MSCNELRDQLVDVACGTHASAEVSKHVESCAACATTLSELRKTMALLDEWQVPEPTPYFDVRLQARLREEQQKAHASWLDWFRKPVLGAAAALLIAAAVGLMQTHDAGNVVQKGVQPQYVAGTAAGDLQFLDKNSDVLQDFDALDSLDTAANVDNGPTAN
jgi:anti-sigma factor RsiW